MTRPISGIKTVPRYRLGVALSGGGARGFAHGGVLKAMQECGRRPEIYAGVSAGAVAAVLLAAGVEADDIHKRFANCKFSSMTSLAIRDGGGGLFSLAPFRKFVSKCVAPYKRLEDLPVPVKIGVTDIVSGQAVCIDHGEIGAAVEASCSIPVLFRPIIIDGKYYVDGGVSRNLPAWLLRDCCEEVIGVNVSPCIGAEDDFRPALVEVAMRSYHLLVKSNTRLDEPLCDKVVTVSMLARHKAFDLSNIHGVYLSGYSAGRSAFAAERKKMNAMQTAVKYTAK